MANHVAENPLVAAIEGSFRFGADQGVLVAGDLTSAATAKAAVIADVNKLHVSQRLFSRKVNSGIDLIDNYVSGITTGSNLNNAYAVAPGAPVGRTPQC